MSGPVKKSLSETATQVVKDQANEVVFSFSEGFRSAAAMLLASLGLTLAVSEFLGAIAFALLGAILARSNDPAKGRGLAFTAGATACAFSLIAIWGVGRIGWEVPAWLIALVIGWFSRPLAAVALGINKRVEQNPDQVIDGAIGKWLPFFGKKK